MQRFARFAKSLATVAPRVSVAGFAAPVSTAAAPARSFSLFYNPPPQETHCKEVVAKQAAAARHTPLDHVRLIHSRLHANTGYFHTHAHCSRCKHSLLNPSLTFRPLCICCFPLLSATLLFPQQNKTSMEYIAEVPVIDVDGVTAICDGGDTFGGHPRVFMQLNNSQGKPATCKYCGLRYQMKKHHH